MVQPAPGWEDVEPSAEGHDGGSSNRTAVGNLWRHPLGALNHCSSDAKMTPAVPTTVVDARDSDLGHVECAPTSSSASLGGRPQDTETREPHGEGLHLEAEKVGEGTSKGLSVWRGQQQQRQQDEREDVRQDLQDEREGVVVVGEIEQRQRQQEDKAGATEFDVGPFEGRHNFSIRHHIDNGSSTSGGERRGGGDSSRVRGFHDMICIGFAVSLILNLGSFTARKEGYFAAEVKCLPQGASQTVLPDLGVWVGWRQAVANSEEAVTFNLEEMSMVGAVMGILTVVGNATDGLLNAVGLAVLLYGRRKPLQEAQCRMVKRLCLASLAMAGWLMGMTVIGFLIAVKGPIGAAAVAFYSEEFDLDCGNSVSVSVDYAYAMATLTVLCQFFIGIVALPKPSRSSPQNRRRRRFCCRWNPAGVLLAHLGLGGSSAAFDENELPSFAGEAGQPAAAEGPVKAKGSRRGSRLMAEGIVEGGVGVGRERSFDPV
ncbi:unnamed protein product [Ectocarpus sp. CCAP 1310/34]|nr:unnamed protein product [Ectocarpus sp. CCAP 1310/34]